MSKQIELTRHRNINLSRREKGEVLEVGKDLPLGQAQTLVRIGGAVWVEVKPAKQKKKKTKEFTPDLEAK